MVRQYKPLRPESKKQQPDLSKLAAAEDLQHISPVEYAHDPLPRIPDYLTVTGSAFPHKCFEAGHPLRNHAIKLQPRASCLSYRCSLDATYECRFWRSGLESSTKLLHLLAADRSATDIVVGNGTTMAKLAKRELRPGIEHRFCKATTYMYPFCDEERTKLLASSMVMMFLFDDKGEETSESTLKPFVEDFVQRLSNDALKTASDSELQKHIDTVMQGFRKADSAVGNGGREVIEAMSNSFRRMRPEMKFHTLEQYLEFRHDNVGANYVLAATKFAIGSNVNIADPRLARYLRLIKDHLAIINDMASFDKEKRDFDNGSSKDLINIVDVIQRLLSLPDTVSSKALAYVYQLQTEAWMKEELQRLEVQEELDAEQWQYLEATYACAAGNAFFSMTSSRYGGEAARIHAQRNGPTVTSVLGKRQANEEGSRETDKKLRVQEPDAKPVDYARLAV